MSATLTPLPSPLPGLASHPTGPKPCQMLPFPSQNPSQPFIPAPLPERLPEWPVMSAVERPVFPPTWPSPLTALPSPSAGPATQAGPVDFPDFATAPVATPPPAASLVPQPEASTAPAEADFTDDDLREAFGPIMETAIRNAVYAKENGIDTYLEPMLRATIRRALAEYTPASRPFQAPGAFDRFIWHVQALFTSRTYEDIFFEKTRRFQVEEVFLLDVATLAMVSFASCDPARHASARRISSTAQRLALQLRGEDGEIRPSFEISDARSVISRKGAHVIIVAVVRGQAGELVQADLAFSLRRIEDHFREQFQQEGSSLLYALQPFLEDCLLIQSPASAA